MSSILCIHSLNWNLKNENLSVFSGSEGKTDITTPELQLPEQPRSVARCWVYRVIGRDHPWIMNSFDFCQPIKAKASFCIDPSWSTLLLTTSIPTQAGWDRWLASNSWWSFDHLMWSTGLNFISEVLN